MQVLDLSTEQRSLFDQLCSPERLRAGFKAVKKNRGSPGIDGITLDQFESRLDEELAQLQNDLQGWRYAPKPVRQVDIPKPGSKREFRTLGVPTVRDRVVQTTLKTLLEPLFDPFFSPNSYGFRPGRNQEQAVKAAQEIVAKGKEHCVDVDLSKFFDRVNHDRLIGRLSKTVADKRVVKLIGMTLRSGIMKDGLTRATNEGTTQGSPLSPLLSNIVLDELDKELERRGIEFCRFADDCNAFLSSQKAAERTMANITRFVEGRLKLQVNQEKSKVAHVGEVKFLGMTITGKSLGQAVLIATLAISDASMQRAMAKVRELTPRGTHHTLETTIEQINRWYTGWANYYQMTQYPAQLKKIEAHVRRRLRARLVDQAKDKRGLYKKLRKQGVSAKSAGGTVYSGKRRWALSHTPAVERAFSNEWFRAKGLITVSNRNCPHWFRIGRWIKLT